MNFSEKATIAPARQPARMGGIHGGKGRLNDLKKALAHVLGANLNAAGTLFLTPPEFMLGDTASKKHLNYGR
jgi:hypothetical protein